MVISTMGIDPPVASVTVPEMVPPVTCADKRGTTQKVRNAANNKNLNTHTRFLYERKFITSPPIFLICATPT
jgi:hypothetical protein